MKKEKKSLRRELIYDLSLLTFCSLILSSGLLVVLIRIHLPELFRPVAESYLHSLDYEFQQKYQPAEFESDQILQKFSEFLKQDAWLSDVIELSVVSGDIEQVVLRDSKRTVLFFGSSLSDIYYQVPFREGGVLSYRLSLQKLHQFLDEYKYIVFFTSIFVAALLVMIGYHLLFRRNILIPIQKLRDVAISFLNENWSARYEVNRRDELGRIGEALNEMAGKIVEKEKKLVLSIKSLQNANEEIESNKNEQLQIEKLASVGRLAAGVAHEVGNPLGAISGYVDILRRSLSKIEKMEKEDLDLLDRIESETNRISKIIRALLQQARPPQDRIRAVAIKPILDRSLELAQIPDSVKVVWELEDQGAEALCEKDQLIQVILNLLINARHAVEAKAASSEEKQIKIRCVLRRLPLYQGQGEGASALDSSVVRALKPQNYWMISIVDNGVGISLEDQKKLFEPFFSTKETGKGTGLGLYVAKSIIESFRGAIVVQSEPGFGSSFSVFLPKDL